MSNRYWGIDLGGTKIEVVVADEEMNPLIRRRIATEAKEGYRHITGRIVRLLDMVSRESGFALPKVIGMGTPGRYDADAGVLKNSNTLCLNGRNLKVDIEDLLQCAVLIENDANCFALAESLLGSGRNLMRGSDRTAFGMIIGTGVGGGIVCGDRVLHGAHGIAGEWGHNELVHDGEPCYCGKRGCVETVISGPALERYYCSLTGISRSLQEIAGLCEIDRSAEATIGRLVDNFARALASVLNILDPDCCIIGGGVGCIGRLYSKECIGLIERSLFSARLQIPLLKPQLGDSAGVFGAALLAVNSKQ
ncbi:ROK family protein [Chlorobium limicola]|uniref:ROK family transcriptional regulator n=1 Tax=Chlorobium limicola TaxID=1092 RepID=A0A101JR48_CHLLI|nr:ROK family protein [Chlorobium limicola]KUL31633.1 ROK family transcriptional regulator [Chlorobium limicola]